MSRLGSAAGVAPNTIYWCLKDKDESMHAQKNRIYISCHALVMSLRQFKRRLRFGLAFLTSIRNKY